MTLLYESCVQADCFSDLLLNQVVSVASDLEVTLHLRVDRDDGLAYGHQRLACLIEARVEVQLVKHKTLLGVFASKGQLGALKHSEKQTVSMLVVVWHTRLLLLEASCFSLRVGGRS